MTAGAKYVSGDITFTVSYADGEGKDIVTLVLPVLMLTVMSYKLLVLHMLLHQV